LLCGGGVGDKSEWEMIMMMRRAGKKRHIIGTQRPEMRAANLGTKDLFATPLCLCRRPAANNASPTTRNEI